MADDDQSRRGRLTQSLRRVVLLRETGPKSAAWHRARAQTIWRLHRLLERQADDEKAADDRREDAPER
ncbi:hypothetical protein K2Z83_07440 [Oscillochloris sp. ZM17-4]|uniref:hypothetical protein n=1 Tax=Oscillochloris sp. ZM17-4 TaxID=2866714 RepID=UPI001C72BE3D|nr:hypothetical protein [Oscillochloris sp. ZM17-4]MBX0327511.1 hypothetical protein [Oscillochloris sp. ZM17-4]